MFQYTKKCSTRQKRRARRQNCKVERSATNSFTPEGDHQAGQEGRYENTTYIYISSYRARCQRIRQCRCACMREVHYVENDLGHAALKVRQVKLTFMAALRCYFRSFVKQCVAGS